MSSSTLFAAVAACALVLTLGACATATPASPPAAAAAPDCEALAADTARAADARRSAAQKQEGAWKAVVPVAVAVRYAEGKGAVGEAERHLAALQAQSAQQGCVSP